MPDELVSARSRPGSIGFGAKVIAPEDRKEGQIFREVEPEDLLKYGLIPEFVGRLPVIATLEDLGLRSMMEATLLDSMFDLPSLEGVKQVVISQQVVKGTAGPLYMYTGGARAI